jgi:hypothetical protein
MGPFATAAEFCRWTGIPEPPDLGRIQALLQSASSIIRGEVGQTLSLVQDDTVILTANWSYSIFLPEAPVNSITSITEDAVPFTNYVFSQAGQITRGDGFVWDTDATVVYSHGYAESSSEFDQLRSICIQMVKRAYTYDERGQAVAQGGVPMETVMFPTAVFLTEQERMAIPSSMVAAVG